jgi:hypothetical protein
MSFFSSLGSAIADLLPTIHAEEVAEPEAAVVESSSEEAAPAEAEEEEEDEPEDVSTILLCRLGHGAKRGRGRREED